MGGETDGGRGVGDKMKDIENVEDKKMSEEETRELFKSLQDDIRWLSIAYSTHFRYRDVKPPIVKGFKLECNCKLGKADKHKSEMLLKKQLYRDLISWFLAPLSKTEYLDYFVIMYEIIINKIIQIHYKLIRKKYGVSDLIPVMDTFPGSGYRKRFDNEFKKVEENEYRQFLKDYEESRTICEKELIFVLKHCKHTCFGSIECNSGLEELLEYLNEANLESAFMVGNSNERLQKKTSKLGELYSEEEFRSMEIKKARTFLLKYSISLPMLYVWAGCISEVYGGDNTEDDLIDVSKLIPAKLKIYRAFLALPLWYRDEYYNDEKSSESMGYATWSFPSFAKAEYKYDTPNEGYELRCESEPIPLEILTNFPQKNIIVKISFDRIEQYCKLASPKLCLLIDKYKKEKKIQNTDIFEPVFMNKSTFYRIFNGESKPGKGRVLLLILGMKLTKTEAEELLKTTKYDSEKATGVKKKELDKYYEIIEYVLMVSKNKKFCKTDIDRILDTISSKETFEELKTHLK